MSTRIKFLIVILLIFGAKSSLNAQRIALTTNVLEDIVLTPNFGVDFVVTDKQSVSIDASLSPYKLSNAFHNKAMTVRAGYKFWFNQTFYSHYIGIDAVASSSDFKVGQWETKGEYVGLGLGYGYSFILGKRLNLVPSVGAGVAYVKNYQGHDHMVKPGEGVEAIMTSGFKPMLTRLSLTFQYVLY